MNILIVNRWYPPYTGYGGVAMYNHYLAHGLKKLGHQVSILSARNSATDPALQDDDGIQVIRILAEHKNYLHRLPIIGRYMRPFLQWRYSN
jgi:glycosyltransferase involved in cell wall biosynthesis